MVVGFLMLMQPVALTSVVAVAGSALVGPTVFAVIDPAEVDRLLYGLSPEEEDDTSLPWDFGVRDKVVGGHSPAWARAYGKRHTYSTAINFLSP